SLDHRRMNDAVELGYPAAIEGQRGQPSAINRAVRAQNLPAKGFHQLLVDRLAGAVELVHNLVGVNHFSAQVREYSGDRGFAAGHAAGQAHAQHRYLRPRRMVQAFTVLAMSMAIVNGPTPPGTGVMAPATSAARGSTSPTSVEPFSANAFWRAASPEKNLSNSLWSVILLMPTSMTAAPGFTKSLVTNPARPMAATRISPCRATAGRSRVLEWQTVTVALPLSSSMATGFPTMSLRPITTALRPSMGIWLRFRISITPAGVHGTSPGRCVER